MRYSLFISDFDGTLVRADGTISKENIEAIKRYRERGGVFAVCTGRMLGSILPRLKELDLKEGLVVAYQGATSAYIRTGALLKNDGFSREDALKAVRYLEKENHHIHVYTVNELFCNRDDEPLHIYEQICGVKGTVVDIPLSEYIQRENLTVVKVLAMVEKKDRNALQERLQRALGERFFATCSSDFLVEVMPAGQDKSAAVDFLSDYYHVPHDKIAAIGDQMNDLPMLARAGGRFAVENAEEPLKECSTVVPSVEKDGVAYAILNFAMGE